MNAQRTLTATALALVLSCSTAHSMFKQALAQTAVMRLAHTQAPAVVYRRAPQQTGLFHYTAHTSYAGSNHLAPKPTSMFTLQAAHMATAAQDRHIKQLANAALISTRYLFQVSNLILHYRSNLAADTQTELLTETQKYITEYLPDDIRSPEALRRLEDLARALKGNHKK